MPEYRRWRQDGGTYFFTVVTCRRRRFLTTPDARRLLRKAIADVRAALPFQISAMVLLPDHLHCIWTLPRGDDDYSSRWGRIKKAFTQAWLASGHHASITTSSRHRRHERGVWQTRFWEHTIRSERDFELHLNYIHYIPVRHGLATCPHSWPYSSFNQWVRNGAYPSDWQCTCTGRRVQPPDFSRLVTTAME